MSQFMYFYGVKFLASKSGTWEFWTNFMSVVVRKRRNGRLIMKIHVTKLSKVK